MTACLAIPCRAADVPQGLPLQDIKISNGQAAKIEADKDGFLVDNAASIDARLVTAEDGLPAWPLHAALPSHTSQTPRPIA